MSGAQRHTPGGYSGVAAHTLNGSASGPGLAGAVACCCSCRSGCTADPGAGGNMRRGRSNCPAFWCGEAGCVAGAMAGLRLGSAWAATSTGLGGRGREGGMAACWCGDPTAAAPAPACVSCRLRARSDSFSPPWPATLPAPILAVALVGEPTARAGGAGRCCWGGRDAGGGWRASDAGGSGWGGRDAGCAPPLMAANGGAFLWDAGRTPPTAAASRPPRASAARWRSSCRRCEPRPSTHESPKKSFCVTCVRCGVVAGGEGERA